MYIYIYIFIWAPESTFSSAALFVFLSVFASSNCFMLGLGWLGGVGWGNNVLAVAKITCCHKNFFIAFPHPLHATLYTFDGDMSYRLGWGWLGWVGWGNNAVAKITRCHKNFFIAFPHPLHATLYTFDGDTSYRLGWGWLGWVGWGNNVLALTYPLAVTSYTFLLATSEEVL